MAAPRSCASQSIFCCILRNFAFLGKSVTPLWMLRATAGGVCLEAVGPHYDHIYVLARNGIAVAYWRGNCEPH